MDDSQALAIGRAVLEAAESLSGPGQVVVHFRADRRATSAVAVLRPAHPRPVKVLDEPTLAARQ